MVLAGGSRKSIQFAQPPTWPGMPHAEKPKIPDILRDTERKVLEAQYVEVPSDLGPSRKFTIPAGEDDQYTLTVTCPAGAAPHEAPRLTIVVPVPRATDRLIRGEAIKAAPKL